MRSVKTLIRLRGVFTGRQSHLEGFVMRWLILYFSRMAIKYIWVNLNITVWKVAFTLLLNPTATSATNQIPAQTVSDTMIVELTTRVDSLENIIKGMARQLMTQQLFLEEHYRSDYQSGVRKSRNNGRSFATIHDRSNHIRTVGLGEIAAAMNGVEFRTRHNDYRLGIPSQSSTYYHKMEDVPSPEVPPSVLNQPTVEEQITEMRKYFEAFNKQDKSIRNYEPYFKPVLCYLEGAWTIGKNSLTHPFHSDGQSDGMADSFLPTKIINVTEAGQPVYAKWNYRIMFHPMKTQLSIRDFHVVDDLAARMQMRLNLTAFGRTRAARFHLGESNGSDNGYGYLGEGYYEQGLIDKIMEEVPGNDNYPGHITDNTVGHVKYTTGTENNTELNMAYYHRYYKILRDGQRETNVYHRGYSDANLWVASTTHPEIAELDITDCPLDHLAECQQYKSRITYAMPLEIIWLTPLSNWNPYHLTMHYSDSVVSHDGRYGGLDKDTSFNGTSSKNFYRTPGDFFLPRKGNTDATDTANEIAGVLDKDGVVPSARTDYKGSFFPQTITDWNALPDSIDSSAEGAKDSVAQFTTLVRRVTSSGIRAFLPEIPGAGSIRLRYQIMPTIPDGRPMQEELKALQEIVMKTKEYGFLFENSPNVTEAAPGDTPDSK